MEEKKTGKKLSIYSIIAIIVLLLAVMGSSLYTYHTKNNNTINSDTSSAAGQSNIYGFHNLFNCITSGVSTELTGTYAFAVQAAMSNGQQTYTIIAEKSDGIDVTIATGIQDNVRDVWYSNGTLYYSSIYDNYNPSYYSTFSYTTIDLTSNKYNMQKHNLADTVQLVWVLGSDSKYIYYTDFSMSSTGAVNSIKSYSLSDSEITELLSNAADIEFAKIDFDNNLIYYTKDPNQGVEGTLYANNLSFNDEKEVLTNFKTLYNGVVVRSGFIGNNYIYQDDTTGYIKSFNLNTHKSTILISKNIQSILFKDNYVFYSIQDKTTGKISIIRYDGKNETTIYNYSGSSESLALSDFGKDKIYVYESTGDSGAGAFIIDTNGNYISNPNVVYYDVSLYYM